MIKFIRTFDHDLPIPARATEGSAGFDLCAAEDVTIYSDKRYAVRTGWSWDVDPLYSLYGRIAPRSGLAHDHGIGVMAGVVDKDYQGEIKVILINHDERPFKVAKGMRIAQLIPESYLQIDAVEAESITEETERGAGGFGSTGS